MRISIKDCSKSEDGASELYRDKGIVKGPRKGQFQGRL